MDTHLHHVLYAKYKEEIPLCKIKETKNNIKLYKIYKSGKKIDKQFGFSIETLLVLERDLNTCYPPGTIVMNLS